MNKMLSFTVSMQVSKEDSQWRMRQSIAVLLEKQQIGTVIEVFAKTLGISNLTWRDCDGNDTSEADEPETGQKKLFWSDNRRGTSAQSPTQEGYWLIQQVKSGAWKVSHYPEYPSEVEYSLLLFHPTMEKAMTYCEMFDDKHKFI